MPPLISAEALPKHFYRHSDGGIYRVTYLARHTENLVPLVIYEHVWPFAPSIWARPLPEWAARFTPVSHNEVAQAMKGDRGQAQEAVVQAKASRRAARDQRS